MKETIPCKQCICRAICRHKDFNKIQADCSIANDYLAYLPAVTYAEKINEMAKMLDRKWRVI